MAVYPVQNSLYSEGATMRNQDILSGDLPIRFVCVISGAIGGFIGATMGVWGIYVQAQIVLASLYGSCSSFCAGIFLLLTRIITSNFI